MQKKVSFGKVPKLCIQRNSSKLTKRQSKANQRLNPPQSGSSFLKTNASSTIGPRSVGGDRRRSPGGLLPLRGRVRIQHPGALHPCSDCVHAGSDGLLFQNTPTPLDALLNPKHETGISRTLFPLVVFSGAHLPCVKERG